MLAEFLKYLSEQAVKAAGPHVIKPPGGPAHMFGLQRPDGTVEWADAPPAPRDHKALDVGTVAAFAASAAAHKFTPAVWYSRDGAACLTDDATRRDRVTMPLRASPQLAALMVLEANPRPLNQRQAVLFLRVSLAGCLGRAGNLVEVLRKLKFRKDASGSSEISQGRASIGRSLTAELTGAESIPEEVTLDVPVFTGQPWRSTVACSLEADPATETFSLIPLAGAVEAAVREGEAKLMAALADALAAHECQVEIYYGTP